MAFIGAREVVAAVSAVDEPPTRAPRRAARANRNVVPPVLRFVSAGLLPLLA